MIKLIIGAIETFFIGLLTLLYWNIMNYINVSYWLIIIPALILGMALFILYHLLRNIRVQ